MRTSFLLHRKKKHLLRCFFNVVSPQTIHYLCAHVRSLTYCHLSSFFFKNCPITQFARKIKTVVQVVFGLFPLFDNSRSIHGILYEKSQCQATLSFPHFPLPWVRWVKWVRWVRWVHWVHLSLNSPCAAHMKIRESSTLKFIKENFSAQHHINFSAQRSNFRRKPARLCIVHYELWID